MMLVIVEEKIKQTPEWDQAVYGATKLLEELVRGSPIPLEKVEWSLVWYKERFPGFQLKIADDMASTAARCFTLEELKNGKQLRGRLRWLWGDLLSASSKTHLARLHEIVANLED